MNMAANCNVAIELKHSAFGIHEFVFGAAKFADFDNFPVPLSWRINVTPLWNCSKIDSSWTYVSHRGDRPTEWHLKEKVVCKRNLIKITPQSTLMGGDFVFMLVGSAQNTDRADLFYLLPQRERLRGMSPRVRMVRWEFVSTSFDLGWNSN